MTRALAALLLTLCASTAVAATPRCPATAEAAVGLALLALERGSPADAVAHLRRAKAIAPQCPELWQGRMHRAVAARVAQGKPLGRKTRAQLARAERYLRQRRFLMAEPLLWELHAQHPKHPGVQNALLVLLSETGRLDRLVGRVLGEVPAPAAPASTTATTAPRPQRPWTRGPCRTSAPWPLWTAYADHFVTADGRVVDHTDGARSTSEGQAYGLFHALVAGDRQRFDKILAWADANLARGKLGARLPAWHWGRKRRGGWGVIDPNPASDADLWMVYALVEAARLWRHPPYHERGLALARTLVAREVATLPGLGPMLLPGPAGFVGPKGWTLNPSYVPLQLLTRLERAKVPGPWAAIAQSTATLLVAVGGSGFAPDWLLWRREGGAVPGRGDAVGSYDAIRTYLWAGMLAPTAPHRRRVASALSGMNAWWLDHGWVPEKVDSRTGEPLGQRGPVGFLAALLPDVSTRAPQAVAQRLRAQISATRRGRLYGTPPVYYDHNLLLFGLGYADGRFRFGPDGALAVQWEAQCPRP